MLKDVLRENLEVVFYGDKQEESKIILDKILKFPDFNHETFLQAMGHTQVKWFDVWKKKTD